MTACRYALTVRGEVSLLADLPSWASNSGKLNGSTWGLILIHVAFQSGFCTFVLSNYMKLLPKSLNEAARMDGASVWKQYLEELLNQSAH